MNGRFALVAAAFALTALSYGLGRFAYGLLLPQIRNDLALSGTAAGWIGSSAFAAYCLGIVAALLAGERVSPRFLAMLAGAAATLGMTVVTLATGGWMLGTGIGLAGLSTGLTSPPLASGVSRRFDERDRPRANGAINTGTAAGIVFSGLAAALVAGAWRELYALFAVIGGSVTVWLWFAMPADRPAGRSKGPGLGVLERARLSGLCFSALLMGASSTAVWTFGADLLREGLGFSDERIALAWVVLGAAGIVGLSTGALVARFGLASVHRSALLTMAIGMAGLSAASLLPMLAFAAMGLFGAAYIVSSGAFLLQGIARLPDRPDLGLGVPFLTIAIGQTIGAPLLGVAMEQAGAAASVLVSAAIAIAAMGWPWKGPLRNPRRIGSGRVCVEG